ncbi:hypothetical protein TNCV_4498441 [Trichonephila clavipes]|nr:hypothetical protein TNCV_4498441 [Trichonephila clavipes]
MMDAVVPSGQDDVKILENSHPIRYTKVVAQQTIRTKANYAISVHVILGPEVHEQMFRSGGQPRVKSPVFRSQASLVLIYQNSLRDERLSRPCPAWGLSLGPVVWID